MIYDSLVAIIGEPVPGSEFIVYLCRCAVLLFFWDTFLSFIIQAVRGKR